jgi:hypothetical protein
MTITSEQKVKSLKFILLWRGYVQDCCSSVPNKALFVVQPQHAWLKRACQTPMDDSFIGCSFHQLGIWNHTGILALPQKVRPEDFNNVRHVLIEQSGFGLRNHDDDSSSTNKSMPIFDKSTNEFDRSTFSRTLSFVVEGMMPL